ncbi:MAG: MotA/TolQ/ExbB proton channel family protein [Thermotaleaceae bacterium]
MEKRDKNIRIIVIAALVFLIIHSLVGSISLRAFLNITAIEIIFAGIILSIIISFSFDTLIFTIKMIRASFTEHIDYAGDIHKIHQLSIKVKREGALSILPEIESEDQTFLRDAMVLLNDYKKPEVMRDILEKDIEARRVHLYRPYNVLKMISHVAPSFGLVGTLIGMIALLSNMDKTHLIMSNMASALVSTLYGALIANFIAIPLMGRLKEYIDRNILRFAMITEGILLIAENDSPRNVFDKMNVMLKESQRLEYPKQRMEERNDGPYGTYEWESQ